MKIESKRVFSFAVAFHRISSGLIVSASSSSLFSTVSLNSMDITPSLSSHDHAFHPLLKSSSNDNGYLSLPEHMKLKKVILFTRHGDRSQISRTCGEKYKENDQLTEFWKSKLPSHETTLKLHNAARIINLELEPSDIDGESVSDFIKSSTALNHDVPNVYIGWDSINTPYGMLTELGSQQLQHLGISMRARYFDLLMQHNGTNDDDDDHSLSSSIYCRSTNMCRTILSLRSFLTGFLQSDTTTKPLIVRRHKLTETLYPQADGPCHKISQRREHLFSDNFIETKILSDYEVFEKKIKRVLGFENHPVNWLVVKEVLTCHTVHGIKLPEEITDEDIDKATIIAATMWGRLYNVSHTNMYIYLYYSLLINKTLVGQRIE